MTTIRQSQLDALPRDEKLVVGGRAYDRVTWQGETYFVGPNRNQMSICPRFQFPQLKLCPAGECVSGGCERARQRRNWK